MCVHVSTCLGEHHTWGTLRTSSESVLAFHLAEGDVLCAAVLCSRLGASLVSTFLPTVGVFRVQTWPLPAAFYVCSRNETWVLRFVWLEFPPRSHLPGLTVLLLLKACVLGAGTFNSHPLTSSSRPSASDLTEVGKGMAPAGQTASPENIPHYASYLCLPRQWLH